MPAQKTQGAYLSVGTATAATKVITAITAANPPVVTSAAHGYTNGSIVFITSVVGMTQVNDRAFIVANTATNTFELKGVDGTGYTTYGSGGTAALKTMTEIGTVRSIGPGFDGESPEIDTTHLRSVGKEYLLGLQDFGNVGVNLFITSTTDTGQTRMRALKELATAEAFSVTMPSGQITAFMALVKSFSFGEISPDGALLGSASLRTTNAPSWFA
jgi:hypothetical protein